jgi:hypothetical protein
MQMSGSSKFIGSKQYEVPADSEGFKTLLNSLIDKSEFATDLRCAKIEVVYVTPIIGKMKISRLIKSNSELKFFSDYDYLIEISSSYWKELSDEERMIVLLTNIEQMLPVTNDDGMTKYGTRKKQLMNMESLADIPKDWFKCMELKLILKEMREYEDSLSTKKMDPAKMADKLEKYKERLESKGLIVS